MVSAINVDGVPFYSVGVDSLYGGYEELLRSVVSLTGKQPDYIAYDYEAGDYCGSGIAVAKVGESYYHSNLGHCSCYGPTEAGFDAFSIDDTSVLSPEISKPLYDFIESQKAAA